VRPESKAFANPHISNAPETLTARYKLFVSPAPVNFGSLPKEMLITVGRQFIDSIPDRIEELEREVRRSGGPADWRPDFTPLSLELLYRWFSTQIRIRDRRAPATDPGRTVYDLARDLDVVFTDRTESLCYDVGMYLGESMIAACPGARWGQSLKNRRASDYGEVVVRGPGRERVNPVGCVSGSAWAVLRGDVQTPWLVNVYRYWLKRLPRP
jgi:hypothetical protein